MASRLRQHGIAGAAIMLYCVQACGEEKNEAPTAATSATSIERLDLRAPDIRRILTPEQIEAVLARARDRNIEEVEVEGVRERAPPATPDVWPGVAALFWAAAHPTQAWRIFLPIPPDRAGDSAGPPPDASHPLREPATGIPKMAGE